MDKQVLIIYVGYSYIMINISTKECGLEITELEVTLHIHSVISFERLVIIQS